MAKRGRAAAEPTEDQDQEQTKKPAKTDEEKIAAFRRLASIRVSKAVDAIQHLKALGANPKAYMYSEEQVTYIFERLDTEISLAKQVFANPEEHAKKKKAKSFEI